MKFLNVRCPKWYVELGVLSLRLSSNCKMTRYKTWTDDARPVDVVHADFQHCDTLGLLGAMMVPKREAEMLDHRKRTHFAAQ